LPSASAGSTCGSRGNEVYRQATPEGREASDDGHQAEGAQTMTSRKKGNHPVRPAARMALPKKVRHLKNGPIVRRFANTLSVAPLTYTQRRDDTDYVVFRFAKPEDADTFSERFGGERLATGSRR
jgi:hypothetical protein